MVLYVSITEYEDGSLFFGFIFVYNSVTVAASVIVKPLFQSFVLRTAIETSILLLDKANEQFPRSYRLSSPFAMYQYLGLISSFLDMFYEPFLGSTNVLELTYPDGFALNIAVGSLVSFFQSLYDSFNVVDWSSEFSIGWNFLFFSSVALYVYPLLDFPLQSRSCRMNRVVVSKVGLFIFFFVVDTALLLTSSLGRIFSRINFYSKPGSNLVFFVTRLVHRLLIVVSSSRITSHLLSQEKSFYPALQMCNDIRDRYVSVLISAKASSEAVSLWNLCEQISDLALYLQALGTVRLFFFHLSIFSLSISGFSSF